MQGIGQGCWRCRCRHAAAVRGGWEENEATVLRMYERLPPDAAMAGDERNGRCKQGPDALERLDVDGDASATTVAQFGRPRLPAVSHHRGPYAGSMQA